MKSVVNAKNGKILGCTLFCIDSGEVINNVALVMKAGLDYSSLRDQIYTHPSMSEALNDLFSAFNPQRGFGSIVYNVQICPLQIS